MRNLWIAALGLLLSATLLADVVTLKEGVPERYVVKKGDTLWDVSNLFLEDPWLWPDIWHLNPQVENPHLIYPGDILGFVTVDGETKLTTISRTVKVQPAENGPKKLTPKVRVSPIYGAISAIPRDQIAGFLTDNRIVTEEELENSPYIVGGHEGRIVLGAGDKIFARGNFGDNPLPAYEVFRPGAPYYDPETKEFLGYEARSLGMAEFIDMNGSVGTLQIRRSLENIRLQDRLMTTEQDSLVGTYFPSAPDLESEGFILSVLRGVSSIGQFDVVLINLGQRDDIEPGNIFHLWKRGELINDPIAKEKVRLPGQKGGILMVFKTFEKLSYGLVLDATRPLSVGDQVRSPGY